MSTQILGYQSLLRQLTPILALERPDDEAVALVVIDLEALIELDGILGYAAVDQLVRDTSARLEAALPTNDRIACTGRHQLTCVLPKLPSRAHATLAAHKILRTLTSPLVRADHHFVLAPRLGIAIATPEQRDAGELLRQANNAVHHARRLREPLMIYAPSTDGESRVLGIDLWAELTHAIEESEVHLAYQPQLDLASGRIESAEALLRWTHPLRGPIRPDMMIQLAEGTELISQLTAWVVNTALRECSEYRSAGMDVGVGINLSADNLRDPELVDRFSQALDLWRIPVHKVVVELTETAVMTQHEGSLKTLLQLKDIGLQLSMDDFGTGHSSMARLRDLPLDEIKIDMSFITDMITKPHHEQIVVSMINLGQSLGLRVVAEGVEDQATCSRLHDMGCNLIQGYLIGRPARLPDFIAACKT